MTFSSLSPAAKLSHLIRQYWVMEQSGWHEEKEGLLFPVGAVEMVLHLETPLLRLQNSAWQPEKKIFVEGLQSGILTVKPAGNIRTIGITLYPWATKAFFGLPASCFTNRDIEADVVIRPVTALYDRLFSAKNNEDIRQAIDVFFTGLLPSADRKQETQEQQVIQAFAKLSEATGVGQLKKDWTYSSRLFEKSFKETIGMPAGEMLKKYRMAQALKLLLRRKQRTLTDIAHTSSFYDQSHFIRDFRSYFGTAPGTFQNNQDLLQQFLA